MQYWNETCMLTHLPIVAGDCVVAFIIMQRPSVDDTSRCDSIFSPVSLPIFGTYDGYGHVKCLSTDESFAYCSTDNAVASALKMLRIEHLNKDRFVSVNSHAKDGILAEEAEKLGFQEYDNNAFASALLSVIKEYPCHILNEEYGTRLFPVFIHKEL